MNRFFRAARLDAALYQEIIEDKGALNQALIVVFIYSMAAAYGTFGGGGATTTNIVMITTLLGWYVWAFSTYMVGAKQALNYESTSRAPGVCIIGFIISALFQGLMVIMLFSAFGASS